MELKHPWPLQLAKVSLPPPRPRCVIVTYQPPLGFEQGPVDAVHLVVEPAGVAEVVPRAVPPPQRGGHGPTVDTFSPLGIIVKKFCCQDGREGKRLS